ncbi:MAG: FKBP-type peptidyl-prolyl cis-trans isomerase [Muribaculaceae bacterium]|nr:FKBP-type peptidyl-prolyl cis-trans isomerase [Muribaculaceae bacterium]
MRLPVFLSLVLVAGISTAAETTDSVSAATATVWGEYLRPQLDRAYPANDSVSRNEFLRGLCKAFSTPASEAPYLRGLSEGMVLSQRIKQIQEMGLPVDVENFCNSLRDALAGKSTGFDRKSADAYLNSYLGRNTAPDTVSISSQQEFLNKQLERKSVIKTSSGLLFEVITDGTGQQHPSLTDKVKVTYTGRLSDGTVFDSTDEPVTFDVNRLVKGFTEGLLMMKPGGSYRLFIPASLGYGKKGIDGVIPGNSVLDFDVKLIEIIGNK